MFCQVKVLNTSPPYVKHMNACMRMLICTKSDYLEWMCPFFVEKSVVERKEAKCPPLFLRPSLMANAPTKCCGYGYMRMLIYTN